MHLKEISRCGPQHLENAVIPGFHAEIEKHFAKQF